MKPVSFPESNLILGKNQPQYGDLPAFLEPGPEGYMHFKYQLSPEELEHLQTDPHIYFRQMTFRKGFSPVSVSVVPMLPEPYKPKDWPPHYQIVIDHVEPYFHGNQAALDDFLANCAIIDQLTSNGNIDRPAFEKMLYSEVVRQHLVKLKEPGALANGELSLKPLNEFIAWAKGILDPESYNELFEDEFEALRKKLSNQDPAKALQN